MILRKGQDRILVRGVDEIICVTRREYHSKDKTWYRLCQLTEMELLGSVGNLYYVVRPHRNGLELVFREAAERQYTLKIEANKHMVL